MSFDSTTSLSSVSVGVFPKRASTIAAPDDHHVQTITVYLYSFNPETNDHCLTVNFHKRATTEELIEKVLQQKPGLFFKKNFCSNFLFY